MAAAKSVCLLIRDCLMEINQPARAWKQIGIEAWRCEPWNICAVTVRDVKLFELWKDKEPYAVARCRSFAEAKSRAKELEAA